MRDRYPFSAAGQTLDFSAAVLGQARLAAKKTIEMIFYCNSRKQDQYRQTSLTSILKEMPLTVPMPTSAPACINNAPVRQLEPAAVEARVTEQQFTVAQFRAANLFLKSFGGDVYQAMTMLEALAD